MNILALDLGTTTGFAYNMDGVFKCGSWLLATPKEVKELRRRRMDRRQDPRILKLHQYLTAMRRPQFDAVVFEDVQFASYTLQVQLWSSLRASVWLAYGPAVIVEAVPVGTLKKFATGNGAADKDAMAEALVRQDSDFTFSPCRGNLRVFYKQTVISPPLDDNAVDAVWLHKWAAKNLSRVPL